MVFLSCHNTIQCKHFSSFYPVMGFFYEKILNNSSPSMTGEVMGTCCGNHLECFGLALVLWLPQICWLAFFLFCEGYKRTSVEQTAILCWSRCDHMCARHVPILAECWNCHEIFNCLLWMGNYFVKTNKDRNNILVNILECPCDIYSPSFRWNICNDSVSIHFS